MEVTLLIDTDVLLWRASSAVQRTFDFGGGVFAVGADFHRAKDKFDAEVRELVVKLKATNPPVLALSDPKRNWRKEVLPTYKANRSSAKPKIFYELREHAEASYDTRWYPGLEGDDVLGLYSTGSSISGKKIIVSIDKDLQTIPGHLYNPNKPERGVRLIRPEEADEYHLMQALTGDTVDGYSGCPGIGPKRAAQILALAFTPEEKWRMIVRAFASKGLNESYEIVQAQVARILRRGEYDKETYRVTTWTPPSSTESSIPASAKSSTPAPAATPPTAKAARTSSRRSSSNASRSTSRTARRSTATTTGRRGSPSAATTPPPSATS